jgi:hypothetical protein
MAITPPGGLDGRELAFALALYFVADSLAALQIAGDLADYLIGLIDQRSGLESMLGSRETRNQNI